MQTAVQCGQRYWIIGRTVRAPRIYFLCPYVPGKN